LDVHVFDVIDHLHELRCRETGWLVAHRAELVREQRRLRVEELAVTRVLDERGALDRSIASDDGVSERTARQTVETARALESLPRIAAAAHAGALSDDQLGSVAQLADPASDAEWAARAPNVAPADLSRMVRCQRKPTTEEGRARREARSLRWWWAKDRGMLQIRGELPDIDGARVEGVLEHMIERMTPPKGQLWDSRDHRGADAFVTLVLNYESVEVPVGAPKPLLVVSVPPSGPATLAGIPLPDAMVERLRAHAAVEPVLVEESGAPIAIGVRGAALAPKIARAILLRDGRCRCGNCELRHGLEVHHLVPRSWGGSDHPANLAAIAAVHHSMLIPQGPWALVGNANQPDGLRLVRYGALSADEARHYGLPPPPRTST
jgi:hypothetical protein